MKKYKEPTPEDYIAIAEKVRSGEYFRESRAMYDCMVNDAMSERYFYLFVTAIALMTMLIAFYAMQSLYPLSRNMPFIYASYDVVEDVPRMISLKDTPHQSASEAVLHFLAANYVKQRESYDIATLERNMNGLNATSTPEVFAEYQRFMQPTNPNSPVVQYQRHSTRSVKVASVNLMKNKAGFVEVVYDATIIRSTAQKTTRYIAQVGYEYSGVALDNKTGKVNMFDFVVTSYSTKEL